MFDYTAAKRHFWEHAANKADYKPVCKFVFDAELDQIAFRNSRLDQDQQSVTKPTDFESVWSVLRISKGTYYDALTWLDQNGIIQYIKGSGSLQGVLRFLHLPQLSGSASVLVGELKENLTRTDAEPVSSPSVLVEELNKNLTRLFGELTAKISELSPLHTSPKEVLNILPTNNPICEMPVGGSVGLVSNFEKKAKGYTMPVNIFLTDAEEQELSEMLGNDKMQRVLMLVSSFKKKKGGVLASSDYSNIADWAIATVAKQDKEADAFIENLSKPGATSNSVNFTHNVHKTDRPEVVRPPRGIYANMGLPVPANYDTLTK